MPTDASACGLKRVSMAMMPSYSEVHVAAAVGTIYIYGDAADYRFERALRRSGQTVIRGTDARAASQADVVLVSDAQAPQIQRSKGNTVVILAGNTQAAGSVRYSARSGQAISDKLAVVERAMKATKRL